MKLIAQVCDYPAANERIELLFTVEDGASNCEQADDHKRQDEEDRLILLGKNIVEYIFGEISHRSARTAVNQHANHGDHEMRPDVRFKIVEESRVIFQKDLGKL